jgi:formiminotetrahydrofolate cyclodeaminase
MLADRPLRDLLEAFASSDPTPGGGSAAALAGALGASLLAMVAGMSKTKTGTPEDRAALDSARTKLLALRTTLVDLIDRDAEAYDLVVAAYKRPRATEADKVSRKAAIQEALGVATSVPLQTLRACVHAMEPAGTVAERGNASAISDVLVGYAALSLGMQAAALNVEINLGSMADATFVESVSTQIRELVKTVQSSARQVYGVDAARDLMMQVARRGGTGHGVPPFEPGTDEFKAGMTAGAAGALLRLGSPEALQALELLVGSPDPVIASRAREMKEKGLQ